MPIVIRTANLVIPVSAERAAFAAAWLHGRERARELEQIDAKLVDDVAAGCSFESVQRRAHWALVDFGVVDRDWARRLAEKAFRELGEPIPRYLDYQREWGGAWS